MPIYQTKGTLTGTIEPENVAKANAYLQSDDMTQYVDDAVASLIERVQWYLNADGHTYYVEAITKCPLNDDELRVLSDWVSGQNSDGLGEGFEQQDFAWVEDASGEEECTQCVGTGIEFDDDDEQVDCSNCGGAGYFEPEEDGCMVSFDWQTNKLPWTRVK